MNIDDDLRAFENTVNFLLAETTRLGEAAKKTKNKQKLLKIRKNITEISNRMGSLHREFDAKYPV